MAVIKKRIRKLKKLRWSMIGMLALCWLLPIMLFGMGMLGFVYYKIHSSIEESIVTSTDKAAEICAMELEDAMAASKNASYEPNIRNSYQKYKKKGNEQLLYNEVSGFLAQRYRYSKNFLCTMLYFSEDPDTIYYTYRNSNVRNATYSSIRHFKDFGKDIIQKISENLGTGIEFVNIKGHLYMVRNLVNSHYEPYSVMVVDLNKDSIFSSLKSIWGYLGEDIYLDGKLLVGEGKEHPFTKEELTKATDSSVHRTEKGGDWVYHVTKMEGRRLAYVVNLDSESIVGELDGVRYFIFILGLFMLPLIVMVFWFFYRKVTRPVNRLVEASREIGLGKYGTQVTELGNSEEFAYLEEAFNSMSSELKHQFEQIYMEELALKDARIKALQSQINPHFLNNTLEIINWEARMNGNEKVSAMIEALSVMLEATMNRKKEHLITLTEEMSYVDAYLYIITQRLGDRFTMEQHVDEALLSVKIPRLIIQPIIENAVEHGKNSRGYGKVVLSVFEKENKVYIEVKNQGILSEKDKEKIDILLNSEDDKENRSLSLGIRNVNRRLRIIYGKEYGLVIKNDEDGNTVSTLTVKIDKENKISQ